mgnify:CR=1 FL=1
MARAASTYSRERSDSVAPALGDVLELAVAVELIAKQVAERHDPRPRAPQHLRQCELIDLEQPELGVPRLQQRRRDAGDDAARGGYLALQADRCAVVARTESAVVGIRRPRHRRPRHRPRLMVAHHAFHLLAGRERLHRAREGEAQYQWPERLPEHEEALAQALPDVVERHRAEIGLGVHGV